MKTYYFIKYNGETTIEHLLKFATTGAVICFDLEDSIKNWIYPEKTNTQKEQYRDYLSHILNELIPLSTPFKIGVRINSDLTELLKDIKILSTLRINSIIIPKVESYDQIAEVEKLLIRNNVFYDELIPTIESSVAIKNLPQIIEANPILIKSIIWGHCDYNLSINAFPFIHSNNLEYWKYIKKISAITIPRKVLFINSVVLDLDNNLLLKLVIKSLNEIFSENYGQLTLTTKQTEICNSFIYDKVPIQLLQEKLKLFASKNALVHLVNEFETENKNQGFTISKANRILISPQEYISAKKQLDSQLPEISFNYVGGCFPVQHNILFEDLFHQKLKTQVLEKLKLTLNINIIRYERLHFCLDKIIALNESCPIEILAFQIRMEPFLRLARFYYRYINRNGELKQSFNIPFLKIINPEKYDMLLTGRKFKIKRNNNNSRFYKLLIDSNYIMGHLFGNVNFALKKYLELVSGINNYCQKCGIKLILLGPATRFNTSYEPILSNKLNVFFKKKTKLMNINYINCLEGLPYSRDSLFNCNGIHANELFHELIANKIFEEVENEVKDRKHHQTVETHSDIKR